MAAANTAVTIESLMTESGTFRQELFIPILDKCKPHTRQSNLCATVLQEQQESPWLASIVWCRLLRWAAAGVSAAVEVGEKAQ